MSKNQLQRFCLAIKVVKVVTGEKSHLIIAIEGQSHHHPPLCAGLFADLSTSCDLSLDSVLFTQLVWEITEGEAWEKIWPLLVTYASFLLLWSKEFNLQVRQGIVWSKDLKGVLGLEMSWAWGVAGLKARYSIALVKGQEPGISCRELLPAVSCLKKAAYTAKSLGITKLHFLHILLLIKVNHKSSSSLRWGKINSTSE